MTTTSEPPAVTSSSTPQALVVIPFGNRYEAEAWASQFAGDLPPVVTDGAEVVWRDPETGAPRHELRFAGGWRAKFAGSGEVVIARGGRRP